jgi:hypothetical protein
VESIGSSQELRLEICSNWPVDTIRKLLVLGAQTDPLVSRMPERRRKVLVWSGLTSWCTFRWRRCLRGYFSLRTAGRRSW